MQSLDKKSLEEHKAYVEQMSRISFFFAWLLKNKIPDESIGNILRNHTPLFFHALNYLDIETQWHNPECSRIAAKADELESLPASDFENEMYAQIEALAMTRAERFYPTSVGILVPPDWNVGSLKYDPPAKCFPDNYCNFHIANAVSPKSIFSDPEYLPECFMELMDRSEKEYGFDTLHTGTWLNDNPRWLKLFPLEWHDNLSPITNAASWHFGYWGQLVTARGTFNHHAGTYLRKNGRLKYRLRNSHCSFQAMRKHLNEFFSAAQKLQPVWI